MLTLEARVARLEKSCGRWRAACLLFFVVTIAVGAAGTSQPPDAQFKKITCQTLLIRSDPAGGSLIATADKDSASLRFAGPGGTTSIGITAEKDKATCLLSQINANGIPSAALSVDSDSGAISVASSSGKSKEIEPE